MKLSHFVIEKLVLTEDDNKVFIKTNISFFTFQRSLSKVSDNSI